MGLENIEIKNFRGIKELKLENLGRINILVGKNNSGKSSVLEACFLLTGMSNPQMLQRIELNRGRIVKQDDEFSVLFYKLDLSKAIQIKASFNGLTRELNLSPIYGTVEPEMTLPLTTILLSVNETKMTGLKMEFTSEGQNFKSSISLARDKINIASHYNENIISGFRSARGYPDLNRDVAQLITYKNTGQIIEVLRVIEPQLVSIQMANNTVFADIGLDKLIPVSTLGDGFNNVLQILSMITTHPNSIILIDEIENGLFYEALTTLWTAIYAACEKYNVQVVATTHSLECIQALAPVLEKGANDIKVYRIEREGDQHGLSIIDSESLKNVIDYSGDIR